MSVNSEEKSATPSQSLTHCLADYLELAKSDVPQFSALPMAERKEAMVQWLASLGYDFNEFLFEPNDNKKYIAIGIDPLGQTCCAIWRSGVNVSNHFLKINRYWFFEPIPLESEEYYESVLSIAKGAAIAALLESK